LFADVAEAERLAASFVVRGWPDSLEYYHSGGHNTRHGSPGGDAMSILSPLRDEQIHDFIVNAWRLLATGYARRRSP
jgi:hypothetical protein